MTADLSAGKVSNSMGLLGPSPSRVSVESDRYRCQGAGDEGGDDVAAVAVEVFAGPVIAWFEDRRDWRRFGRLWSDACVQGGGDEAVPEGV